MGVSSAGHRAGRDNAGNVGNEDGCDLEEACRKAEEHSNACGCCCDELWEVAIKVKGNEAKNWSSQG